MVFLLFLLGGRGTGIFDRHGGTVWCNFSFRNVKVDHLGDVVRGVVFKQISRGLILAPEVLVGILVSRIDWALLDHVILDGNCGEILRVRPDAAPDFQGHDKYDVWFRLSEFKGARLGTSKVVTPHWLSQSWEISDLLVILDLV